MTDRLQGDLRGRWTDDDTEFASDMDYLRSLLDAIAHQAAVNEMRGVDATLTAPPLMGK